MGKGINEQFTRRNQMVDIISHKNYSKIIHHKNSNEKNNFRYSIYLGGSTGNL